MDDVSDLAEEIAALHRGRGLRRTSLPVGPNLKVALHLDVFVGQVEARDRVVAALRASASTLPGDLQTVFLIASALTASEPLLGDRLARAGKELDRDARTIRRRLAEANVGVATVLARGSQQPVEMGAAWLIEEFDFITDLREARPRLTSRKVVTPTLGGVSTVVEVFGLPPLDDDGQRPEITVTEGGVLARVAREGRSLWQFEINLEKPTQVGVTQAIGVQVTVPSRDWLRPYAVFTPYRPCRRMRCQTFFGDPPAASIAWVLDGVYTIQSLDDTPRGEVLDPRVQTSVDLEFEGLSIGYSYGIAWRWA